MKFKEGGLYTCGCEVCKHQGYFYPFRFNKGVFTVYKSFWGKKGFSKLEVLGVTNDTASYRVRMSRLVLVDEGNRDMVNVGKTRVDKEKLKELLKNY